MREPLRACRRRSLPCVSGDLSGKRNAYKKHERERKEKAGLAGGRRGKEAAALDAAGAVLGSVGLAAFAVVIWLLTEQSPSLALVLAAAAWLAVAVLGWLVRRSL